MAMAVKLVYFAIERVTEPVSTFIGTIAERSPVFQAGCRRLARHVDKVAARANIDSTAGAYTHAGLTDEQAAKAGAEILGEGVVWGVGLAVLAHQTLLESSEEREQEQRLSEYERRIYDLEYELAKTNGSAHSRRLAERTADGWRGRLADALGLRGMLLS
mmetsp:Transcript_18134/g.46437  ORF Transcript_18134/g.46437 Transcript_18134/m.46437 type:complete len:160 (+) Transcript_18134:35-514(+)